MFRLRAATIAALELPYRIIEICTGDMGQSHHRSIDLEVYAPGADALLITLNDLYDKPLHLISGHRVPGTIDQIDFVAGLHEMLHQLGVALHGELIDGLERTVLVAVAHDGFRLGGPDAIERLGKRGGIGGVDVDGLGVNELRQQQRGGERRPIERPPSW